MTLDIKNENTKGSMVPKEENRSNCIMVMLKEFYSRHITLTMLTASLAITNDIVQK